MEIHNTNLRYNADEVRKSLNDIIKRFLYLKEIILDNVDDIFPLYKKTYLVSHIKLKY